jgi:hypothetical protein
MERNEMRQQITLVGSLAEAEVAKIGRADTWVVGGGTDRINPIQDTAEDQLHQSSSHRYDTRISAPHIVKDIRCY